MIKHLLFAVSFASLLASTSCSAQKDVLRNQESKNPSLNAHSTGVLVKPIMADLEISSEKKTITYKADMALPFGDLKANAMRVFLETHKCDYIIDPHLVRTSTSRNRFVKEVEYVLTGFAATYKSVYQVDSLPKSIIEYASINLPVQTVNYTTLTQREIKGTSVGMEFAMSGNFAAAQFDYSPKASSGLYFYFALEQFLIADGEAWGRVSFNEIVNGNGFEKSAFNSGMTNLSIGAFKEKEIAKRIKIRGGAGLNYLGIQFFESVVDPVTKTSYDGARSIGLRAVAAIEYPVFNGFSLIGRAHSNFGLFNSIQQSGANTFDIEEIQFENIPLLYLSGGVRFAF
jgi:hypothetical protein